MSTDVLQDSNSFHLDQMGLVHADVKPQNILFVEAPDKSQQQQHLSIKLIDFGNSFHESFFQEYIQVGKKEGEKLWKVESKPIARTTKKK